MELAAAQARRETQQRAEVDSCKVALTKVQEALESKVGAAEDFRGSRGETG